MVLSVMLHGQFTVLKIISRHFLANRHQPFPTTRKWIFIIEGIPSVLMGIIVFFFLPDFPGAKNALRYFTEEEMQFLVERMRADYTDSTDQKIH
jgi:hypothetical protein